MDQSSKGLFAGMTLLLSDKLLKESPEAVEAITRQGGIADTWMQPDRVYDAIVVSLSEIRRKARPIVWRAHKAGIPIVNPGWLWFCLEECEDETPKEMLEDFALYVDPNRRVAKVVASGLSSWMQRQSRTHTTRVQAANEMWERIIARHQGLGF